ncbi:hypothetical protein [Amycolatopsis benzoatilytica]|uniref:hypothetical protein n=1 Tax=Amycolatopsis benzoatilytica TaxID=346045 RepID=UPI0012B6A002|nr:hypothetical protein [Amycolatopsis benzoatilytica]
MLGLDRRSDVGELRQRPGVQRQDGGQPDRLRVGEVLGLFAATCQKPTDPARLLDQLGLGERNSRYGRLCGSPAARTWRCWTS